MLSKFDPVFERPILALAPAARMDRNNWTRHLAEKFARELSILCGRENLRRKIGDENPELFQGTRELSRSVPGPLEFTRSDNQVFDAAPTQIRFEDMIGIVKITDDQIETAEIVYELIRQFRGFSKKTREQAIFD